MNPYRTTGAVRTIDDFYGFTSQKEKVFNLIDQSITGQIRNICFVGEPNTGKTSFINISKEYVDKKSHFSSDMRLTESEYSFDFFNNFFTSLIYSLNKFDGFVELIQDYENVIISGGNENNCNLLFPYKYGKWLKKGSPENDFPTYTSVIKHDIEKILNELSKCTDSEYTKIFNFIDDFQFIIGIDDKGEVNENENTKYKKSAENICNILRSIIDDFSKNLVFIISTYPGVFNHLNYARKLFGSRYFEKINIDKYESKKETEELFIRSLRDLPDDEIWKKIYFNKDSEIYGALLSKQLNSLNLGDDQDGFQKIMLDLFETNLSIEIAIIVNKTHNESEGRPSYIKPFLAELFEIFREFDYSGNKINFIINFEDHGKMEIVYKNLSDQFKDNIIFQSLENYSIEEKFHLFLLLNNEIINVKEIYKIVKISQARSTLTKYAEKQFNFENIDVNSINSDLSYFGKNTNLSRITEKSLFDSLEKFVDDGIINYSEDRFIKYKPNLSILDLGYVNAHLRTYRFPDKYCYSTLDKVGTISAPLYVLYATLFGSLVYEPPVPLSPLIRPDKDPKKEYSKIIEFLKSIVSINNLDAIIIDDDVLYRILELILSTSDVRMRRKGYSLEDPATLELFTIKDYLDDKDRTSYYISYQKLNKTDEEINFRKQALDKLEEYTLEEFDQTQFMFQTYYKQKCDKDFLRSVYRIAKIYIDKNKGKEKSDILISYLGELGYLQLWEVGLIRDAFLKLYNSLSELEIKIENNIIDEEDEHIINAGTFLALLSNDVEMIKSWYNYKDGESINIKRQLKQKSNALLSQYNKILIRNYVDNYSLNNLVKLFEKIIKDSTLLKQSIEPVLTCLMITSNKPIMFSEMVGSSLFDGIFYSLKNLLDEGVELSISNKLKNVLLLKPKELKKFIEENIN